LSRVLVLLRETSTLSPKGSRYNDPDSVSEAELNRRARVKREEERLARELALRNRLPASEAPLEVDNE